MTDYAEISIPAISPQQTPIASTSTQYALTSGWANLIAPVGATTNPGAGTITIGTTGTYEVSLALATAVSANPASFTDVGVCVNGTFALVTLVSGYVSGLLALNSGDVLSVQAKLASGLQSTTIAAGSAGSSLPQSTIFVANVSNSKFYPSGLLTIGASTVSYTGLDVVAESFTGCSGGTGSMTLGETVTGGVMVTTLYADLRVVQI